MVICNELFSFFPFHSWFSIIVFPLEFYPQWNHALRKHIWNRLTSLSHESENISWNKQWKILSCQFTRGMEYPCYSGTSVAHELSFIFMPSKAARGKKYSNFQGMWIGLKYCSTFVLSKLFTYSSGSSPLTRS